MPTRVPIIPKSNWDRGRRLATIAKLAAGSGIILTTSASIAAAALGRRTPDSFDIIVAVVGAIGAFVFFAFRFHVFQSHAEGERRGENDRLDLDRLS